MPKRVKRILAATALVLAAVVAGAGLWLSNPGHYRSLLEERVASATGYELLVAGGAELDLLPSARLALADVRLRNPASTRELASAARIELDVDRARLLRGELAISGIRIDGFHINAHIDAAGNSIWTTRTTAASGADILGNLGAIRNIAATDAGRPRRVSATGGRVDYQNARRGLRHQLKNIGVVLERPDPQAESIEALADFTLEWFDAASGRLREELMVFSGHIETDGESGEIVGDSISLSVSAVALAGQFRIGGSPGEPRYEVQVASNDFDAREPLRTLGWLPDWESTRMSAPAGNPDGQWPTAVEVGLAGDERGLSATATVTSSGRRLIEAETAVRFANGAAPGNVRYEIDIGEIDLGAWLAAREAAGQTAGPSRTQNQARTAARRQPGRRLPAMENLNLSGSISADALTAGALRVENLTAYTNVESRVFDLEIPPVAALGGNFSANLRWNAASGELTSEFRGGELAIAEFAPLITRLDVLTGRLQVDGALSANGYSASGLLDDLRGETTFSVTENLVNIGLIKQIFTSISALSPSGEAIQQWPDLIRFNEVVGSLALNGGLGSEHAFTLRMDNLGAAGTGIADLGGGRFDYDVRLTLLGEPHTQTIPVSDNYRGLAWPVECAASFAAEVARFCRPDFNAAREIFTGIGNNAGGN